MNINEIINSERGVSEIIADLKKKSVNVPEWGVLLKDYEPSQHKVVHDHTTLRDKKNGTEPSARLSLGLEKLLCKRMNEFTFAIPVKRMYMGIDDDETKKAIKQAIEAIYKSVHIDAVNLKRGLSYYASCELFTIWYTVKKPNTLYGFNSEYKLKCKTYSPMDGALLYPLIDELDDMVAMSFQYDKEVGDRTITYFETYTADKHYIWRQNYENTQWEEVTAQVTAEGEIINGEDISIQKIPGVYLYRTHSVYSNLSALRNDIEYTMSRESNVIAYNASPILKVSGGIKGEEDRNESRRIYRVENGGDVSYVSWSQANEAVKYHIDTLLKFYWMQAQLPDISFENMKSLGNIGYDARQTLLTDTHLRIGEETGVWIEAFEREFNVIKAFLKEMNKKWASKIDEITCNHTITPFIQNDELNEINKRIKANGGKAIESQLESIEKYGESENPSETLRQINEEAAQETMMRNTAFAIQNQEE